jgi:acyl-coenzyme A thioesterase PaaI-like protein
MTVLERARSILAAQPFSTLLGTEMTAFGEAGVELRLALTADLKLNSARPAIGQVLIARATVMTAGKTQAVCRGEEIALNDRVERVCLIAQGMVLRAAQPSSIEAPESQEYNA